MKKLTTQLGFTMIELLIVITILGILAVAVLSAINPIEQIRRARDTSSQSDAEQLLSAIDRYNAFQGFFPWQIDANDASTESLAIMTNDNHPVEVTAEAPTVVLDGESCPMVTRLSTGIEGLTGCAGAQELKESFVTRLTADSSARSLYVYNNGFAGASTYVCFVPQSGMFNEKATERCNNDGEAYGAGLPDDIDPSARAFICNPAIDRPGTGVTNVSMVCLP